MTKSSIENASKVEQLDFTLELPTELSIVPWQTIALPRNKSALIYMVKPNRAHDGERNERYDVYIINNKQHNSGGYGNSRNTFYDLPAVKHYLLDLTANLRVKKRTQKTVSVDEADDDE